jgi:uncharacterized protein with HEPN domain
MRNRVVHDYFEVDAAVVWNTVQRDLLPLRALLRRALADSRSGA